jgi:ketosteroid isomerase-like protein
MVKHFRILLAVLLMTGCASVPLTTSAVKDVIDNHNRDVERYYASGATDSLASMFAQNAWQMPPNNPPLVGRDAIKGFWQQAMGWGKWSFSLQAEDVETSGSIAVERGKYKTTFTAGPGAPQGMTSVADHGSYVVFWRREADGNWRIVWDAPVSEVPLTHSGT